MDGLWRHRRRGQPVWRALAVLMLMPLIAAAAIGGTLVAAAARSAEQAVQAQRLVTAVERLDAVRRAADGEVLPTLLTAALADEPRAAELGIPAGQLEVLRSTEPEQLATARAVTDRAMARAAEVRGVPELADALSKVRESLASVRIASARPGGPLQTLADGYAGIATTLGDVQRSAAAEATASGLSAASVAELQDLDLVVQLSEGASRQLAELFASRVLLEPTATTFRRRWLASWGNYSDLVPNSDRLTNQSTRLAWDTFRTSDEVYELVGRLDRQALNSQAQVLTTGELAQMAALSRRRDDGVAVVLDHAVAGVNRSASADREAAARRERVTLQVCLTLASLSLLNAGLVARWLTRSMSSLATSAQQVSLGNLVDVHPRGPRELRVASQALSSAVGGLRRVQEQARAVVAGDLDLALAQPQLPGPLGEVVHASVEQMVLAFRAREALRDELAHQASHDALTGLANRAQTLRTLSASLRNAAGTEFRVGVLFIDLDGFKAVNDGHGHAAGDALLREIAARLVATVRPGDGVGRLGGDEFVITVNGVRAVSELVQVGHRLVTAAARPVEITVDGKVMEVGVGASIGVAVSTHANTADELLVEADIAAYRAKRLGRGRIELFDDDLRTELAERSDLDVAIRAALEAGDLSLHYQPVIGLHSGALVGYEALARWERNGEQVPPSVFIPVAEASPLICELGAWALTTATTQLARWRAEGRAGFVPGGPQPTVAVNLSGRHVADPRVLTDVTAALEASGLPASLLVIEVTETVLMDESRTRLHLQELRALGVRVAIDDFGTGYTSIGVLSTIPADILKIDRSFVDTDDEGRHQLATLIIRTAHTFSFRVVAEGIETVDQLVRMRASGCDDAQGYLFSRPVSADAVPGLPVSPFDPVTTPADPSQQLVPPRPRRTA